MLLKPLLVNYCFGHCLLPFSIYYMTFDDCTQAQDPGTTLELQGSI